MELDLNDCQLINLARVTYLSDPSVVNHPMDSAFIDRYAGALIAAAHAGLPVEDMVEQVRGQTVEP